MEPAFTIQIDSDDTTFEKTIESEDDLRQVRQVIGLILDGDVEILPSSSGSGNESGPVVEQLEALADLVDNLRDRVQNVEKQLDNLDQDDAGGSESPSDSEAGSEQNDGDDEEFDPFKENGLDSLEKNEDGYYELEDVKELSREAQHDLIMQTIREEQPIGPIGITEELFGPEKGTSSSEYGYVNNCLLNLRSQLEKEKDGVRSFYSIPGSGEESGDESDDEVSVDYDEFLSSEEPEVDQRRVELDDAEETEAGKGKA